MSKAERRVLWKLEGSLERLLVEPFARDYADLVERALQRIVAG